MTDRPQQGHAENTDVDSPENQMSGPTFAEWLIEQDITEEGDPKEPPASNPKPPDESLPIAPDIRAALWTLPLGVLWLTGSYITPHLTAHPPATALRLTGLALIAWVISLGCELSIAYALWDGYPAMGMWEWLTHCGIAGLLDRSHEGANRAMQSGGVLTLLAGLALPGLFGALYAFFALLSIAVHILLTLMTVTCITHIAVTVTRNRRHRHDAS